MKDPTRSTASPWPAACPGDRTWRSVQFAGRLFLGGLFIYMGLSKALDPVSFLKLVRQYEMVGSPFALNFIAATLPWFEAFCGLLLLAGVAVRGTALVSCAMLVPFTFLIWKRALVLQAAAQIPFCAVRFDCGCGLGEVLVCYKLLENGLLILLCVGLLQVRTRRDPGERHPAGSTTAPSTV